MQQGGDAHLSEAGDGVQLWSGLAAPVVPVGIALEKYELFFNTGEEKSKW